MTPVSIHAPAKGATRHSARYISRIFSFNPRSREGSDGYWPYSIATISGFNPRSREGSDFDGFHLKSRVEVSIHAPAKGATLVPRYTKNLINFAFQSTLPRRERHRCPNCDSHYQTVSIHAPAKGATMTWEQYFQRQRVSIHAPAKGATFDLRPHVFWNFVFQSTLPRRERLRDPYNCVLNPEFQSTLPRRERRYPPCYNSVFVGFNPRSREGSDTRRTGKTHKGR